MPGNEGEQTVSQAHKLKVHQVLGKKSFPRHVAVAVKTRAAL